MQLERLTSAARRLVTPDFVRGIEGHVSLESSAWEIYSEPAEAALSLQPLHDAVERIMSSFEPHSASMDAEAAIAFHRALPLTRRQASDEGIWRFIAVVTRPDFVRHRWENPSFVVARNRFWSFGTRPDSNAFCRLWWIAELSAGGDYDLTRRVLASQSLANPIFIRSFCEHRPAIQACVEDYEEHGSESFDERIREFHLALSTRALETMDCDQLCDLLTRLRSE